MISKIKNINKKYLIVFIISFIWIVLDQISKFIIIHTMNLGEEVKVIKNFFSLMFVTNTGAAFSSLQNHTTMLIIASVFCIALIVSIIQRELIDTKIKYFSLSILLGGMIGNLIDRILYKKVIDFLSFTIFTYKFPVFNIADIGITCGVIIYLFISLFEENSAKKKKICYNIEHQKRSGSDDKSSRRRNTKNR